MNYIERNARIESTSIGNCGTPIMTLYLHLRFSDGGQAAGGYTLDAPPEIKCAGAERKPTALTGALIKKIIDIVGVQRWEDLPGQYVVTRREGNFIVGIRNILGGEWLMFEEFLQKELDKSDKSNEPQTPTPTAEAGLT